MNLTAIVVLIVVVIVLLMLARMSIRVVRQFEQGVLFRLGRVVGVRMPGLRFIASGAPSPGLRGPLTRRR